MKAIASFIGSSRLLNAFACPACNGRLSFTTDGIGRQVDVCDRCGYEAAIAARPPREADIDIRISWATYDGELTPADPQERLALGLCRSCPSPHSKNSDCCAACSSNRRRENDRVRALFKHRARVTARNSSAAQRADALLPPLRSKGAA